MLKLIESMVWAFRNRHWFRDVDIIWDANDENPLQFGWSNVDTDWLGRETGRGSVWTAISKEKLITYREWQDITATEIGYHFSIPLAGFKIMPILDKPNGRVHKIRVVDIHGDMAEFTVKETFLKLKIANTDITRVLTLINSIDDLEG